MFKKRKICSLFMTTIMLLSCLTFMPLVVYPSDAGNYVFDISEGNIRIEDGTNPNTYKVIYASALEEDNIPSNQMITLMGTTTTNSVSVSATTGLVRIKLAGITISHGMRLSSSDNRNVEIILEDDTINIINNSLSNASTATGGGLTIGCEHVGEVGHICDEHCGILQVNGNSGSNGAGISGHNTTINGGNITAVGGNSSSAIGVYGGTAKNILINGGNVSATASGPYPAAGIGGGDISNADGIIINGGIISTAGRSSGGGIGGGGLFYGSGGQAHNITINDGTIVATGGYGIGGPGVCSNFQINGGSVNASSIKIQPVNSLGANVYKTVITLEGIDTQTQVTDLSITGADYFNSNDIFTNTQGVIYLYLPEGAEVTGVSAGGNSYMGSITTTNDGLAAQTFSFPVCEIDGTGYTTLNNALAQLQEADTIKLLSDINYQGRLEYSKNFELDLNGYVLTVTNTSGIALWADGRRLSLTGEGEFNVTGTTHGVYACDGGRAEVTNATATNANGIGVYVGDPGCSVTVKNNVTATGSNATAVYVEGDFSTETNAVVYGNVIANGSGGIGARVLYGGKLTIEGSITADYYLNVDNVGKTIADKHIPTTKLGYYTYKSSNSTTVWVKAQNPQGAVITLQPIDIVTTFGDIEEELKVEASVDENNEVSYQWYLSNTSNTDDGEMIVGATANQNALPQDLDSGTYYSYCVITETDTASEGKTETVSDIVTVTVNKANPRFTIPLDLVAMYGQTLSEISLPTGFSWEDSGATLVGAAGNNTFKATYTPEDINNYNVINGIDVNVAVKNKVINFVDKELNIGVIVEGLSQNVLLPEEDDEDVAEVILFVKVEEVEKGQELINRINEKLKQIDYELVNIFDISLMKTIERLNGEKESLNVPNSDITGMLKVRIPLSIEFRDKTNLAIAYISDEGEITILKTTKVIIDGVAYLEFETNHFSDYAIVEVSEKLVSSPNSSPNSIPNSSPYTGYKTNQIAYLIFIMVSIVAISMVKKQKINKKN